MKLKSGRCYTKSSRSTIAGLGVCDFDDIKICFFSFFWGVYAGLVNSILDFSKIEAGKMQLEETELDLSQLLEEMADLHHLVAMKKGVEVVLDPCDGSIMKFSHVKGDALKLKQILGNLLSNAVKFTSQGHISIRAWAKKSSLENSIIASNKNSFLNQLLSKFSYRNKRAYSDLEGISTIKQDPNCMEFEFEVEDTGPGIPKEKRESIFENFVQVKENSAGQVGTGLGLGIVQSYVSALGCIASCFTYVLVKKQLIYNDSEEAPFIISSSGLK